MVKESRFWSLIYCTDTCSFDIIDFLTELKLHNVNFVLSPLHYKDVNPKDGTLVVPHYHILLLFDLQKTFDQVKFFGDLINAKPYICRSPHLMVRYFCHLDHPFNEKYAIDDCVFFCDKLALRDVLMS